MSEMDEYIQKQIEGSAESQFCNTEAESAVLGYILSGKADAEDVSAKLSPEDFSNDACGRIFQAIVATVKKGQFPNILAVDQTVTELYPDKARKYYEGMVRCTDTNLKYRVRKVDDYVQILKSLSVRRKAIKTFDKLIGNLRDPTINIRETLAEINVAALETDSSDAVWTNTQEVVISTLEYLDKRQKGEIKALPTGLTNLDNLIGGFFGGELTVVAARPAVGKSAFGLNVAFGTSKDGFQPYFVSCEMVDVGFGQRMVARQSWVHGEVLRKAKMTDNDWEKINVGALELDNNHKINFMFPDKNPNGMTIENVVRAVRHKAAKGEIDILIVDYIGILRSDKKFKEDRDRIKYITSELKKLSITANIPVVALCQVNRDAHGSMPNMSQLRDSGSVEQDADNIIFLHAPDKKSDPSVHKDDADVFLEQRDRGLKYIVLDVAKQRNGETGRVYMYFDTTLMRYAEITRQEEQKA